MHIRACRCMITHDFYDSLMIGEVAAVMEEVMVMSREVTAGSDKGDGSSEGVTGDIDFARTSTK